MAGSMRVVGVHRHDDHQFSKPPADSVQLVAGRGVAGDAHFGTTVQHRSRMARDPSQPNLRQVHLIHTELLEELRAKGYDVHPGQLGENLTTQGVDLLGLPAGALLCVGSEVVLEITGLRNPCVQIERFAPGMLGEVTGRGPDGEVLRRAGVMSVVRTGGVVRPGDPIQAQLPEGKHQRLAPV
ncbi:MAG: MOSC domain-containing protein [Actinomycetota bacterium]|nr:MOSC domain-containing protein [Actinomycetota bacterium]